MEAPEEKVRARLIYASVLPVIVAIACTNALALPMPNHYWPFENSLNDMVGGTHGSERGGTVGYGPAAVAHSTASVDLDGSTFVDIANSVIPNTGPFTISLWFNANGTGTLFNAGQGTKHFRASCYISSGADELLWRYESSGESDVQWRYREDPGVLDTGQWYHIAVLGTWSGSMLTTYLYLDGAPATFEQLRTITTQKPTLSNLTLGEDKGILPPYHGNFDGRMDDLAIWHGELSPADVEALAEGANPIPEPLTLTTLGMLAGVLAARGSRRRR
jgi:hypothetical protein